jgi:hypothetical protein
MFLPFQMQGELFPDFSSSSDCAPKNGNSLQIRDGKGRFCRVSRKANKVVSITLDMFEEFM